MLVVLSLFDGISCGKVALERAGIKVKKYYAAEVDKYAIEVSNNNHPDIIRLGDVENWRNWDIDLSSIDLLIAGSPCQGFSVAGKQLAFDDHRSKLFFTFVEILNHIKSLNPDVKFLLENVRMKKDYLAIITEYVGVEPILINSALVSAQNRQRYYWCNWDNDQPEDKGIMLQDIAHEREVEGVLKVNGSFKTKSHKSNCIDANYHKGVDNHGQRTMLFIKENIIEPKRAITILDNETKAGKIGYIGSDSQANRIYQVHGKSVTINALAGGLGAKTGLYFFACSTPDRLKKNQNGRRFNLGDKSYCLTASDNHGILTSGYIRKLSPIECERLQTLSDGYTAGVSNTQRYKMLGNGWTVDVIAHLFKSMSFSNDRFNVDGR